MPRNKTYGRRHLSPLPQREPPPRWSTFSATSPLPPRERLTSAQLKGIKDRVRHRADPTEVRKHQDVYGVKWNT